MGLIETAVDFLGPWSWWVLGILLAAVEVFFPGAFFIWFAVAALITGTVALSVALTWQSQLILFAVLAVLSALLGRFVYGRKAPNMGDGELNDRHGAMLGQVVVLETEIAGGTGHARIGDTLWRVYGPDLAAGTRVKIASVDNGRLTVSPH